MPQRISSKFYLSLFLVYLLCCEFGLPAKVVAQVFSDTGSFYFSGNHNPLRRPIFREWISGDGLKVGPIRAHPFLGIAEVFTDNVFRTKKNRHSDFLTTIAPGFQALLPFSTRHSLLIDYRAAQYLYARFPENNVFAQNAVGQLKLNFFNNLNFDLQGGHVDGFDSRGSAVDIQEQDITKWRTNSFLGQAEFFGPKAGIRVRLSYIDWHFKNNGQSTPRDRSNIDTGVSFFIPANQSVSGQIGFNVSNQTYDENKQLDNFSYGVFGGFRIRPSRLLSGEFTMGYTILNFDRAPVGDPVEVMELQQKGLSLGGDQQKALTMRGNLLWRPTTTLIVRLRSFRQILQSAVFNTATFTQTGVGIGASKRLTERLGVNANFFYANNNFEGPRRDNALRWRIGLQYKTVEWLGFRVDYSFGRRFSNVSQFDFYSNSIMGTIQLFL